VENRIVHACNVDCVEECIVVEVIESIIVDAIDRREKSYKGQHDSSVVDAISPDWLPSGLVGQHSHIAQQCGEIAKHLCTFDCNRK